MRGAWIRFCSYDVVKTVCFSLLMGSFGNKKARDLFVLRTVKNYKADFLALSLDIGKDYLYN